MASKSGGVVPPAQPLMDANQAIALLSTMHFWRVTKLNSGDRSRYEVDITHAGHRVTASAYWFTAAVQAAMSKLREADTKANGFKMRLAK